MLGRYRWMVARAQETTSYVVIFIAKLFWIEIGGGCSSGPGNLGDQNKNDDAYMDIVYWICYAPTLAGTSASAQYAHISGVQLLDVLHEMRIFRFRKVIPGCTWKEVVDEGKVNSWQQYTLLDKTEGLTTTHGLPTSTKVSHMTRDEHTHTHTHARTQT